MKQFTLNTKGQSDFLDFKIITTQQFWFQNIKSKLTYDFKDKKCYYFLPDNLEAEDIYNLVKEIKATNYLGLNMSITHLYEYFKDFTKLFFDELFFVYDDKYSLKTKTDEKKLLLNVILDSQKFNNDVLFSESLSSTKSFAASLQDTPPNILNAQYFVDQVKTRLQKYQSLKIDILNKSKIQNEKMGLILAVNKASYNEPYVLVINYQGNLDNQETYALVGKGITFDSGGYALKSVKGMNGMKADMSGAAIVCSTLELIAQLKLKVNVVAVACLTDNLIGGQGTVADSVITSMNGQTVEIANPDAEGRLVLADGVTYAIRNCQATKIFTVATLTGAVVKAIGTEFTGIFSKDDQFINEFIKASDKSLERVWRLPLTRINSLNQKHSPIADLWNEQPISHGGASNGAGFMQEFTEGHPLIHLDIAGTATTSENLGTGVMVNTFIEYFKGINNYD